MNANESAEPVDRTVSGSSNPPSGTAADRGAVSAAPPARTAPAAFATPDAPSAMAGALATALARAMLEGRQAHSPASTAPPIPAAPTPVIADPGAADLPSPAAAPLSNVEPTPAHEAALAPERSHESLHEADPRSMLKGVTHPATSPATARAAHDELLAGLGRRFRGATLKLDFELSATITRQLFRRDFVYVSQQLHALEASRRVQGLDRKVLNDALIAVERHGEFVKTLLKQTTAEATTLIALHGYADAQVEFTPPARLQATIISPYARAYIDLLRLADDALTQLDRAWLLGLLDPATKAHRAADCRKALQGFKEVVRQQRHVVGEQVREVNAARRLKRDEGADPLDTSRATGMRRTMADAIGDGDAPSRPERPERPGLADAYRPAKEVHAVAGEPLDDSGVP